MLIVGDSLTIVEESWMKQVPRTYYLDVLGQIGLKITDMSFPNYKQPWGPTPVVYFLGGNDSKDISSGLYVKIFQEHIFLLTIRGYQPHIVIPPDLQLDDPERQEKLLNIRRDLMQICHFWEWTYLDANDVWDKSKTSDGVHPLPELSADLGRHIVQGFGF